MENYEQKYKEAIERCKSWIRGEHPECFTEAQKAGEFIFPELKESEDERIRKGLIKGLSAIRDIHEHQTFSDDAINIDDAIAWLEKQGEQKQGYDQKYIADVFEQVGLAKIARELANDNLTNALQYAMIELSKTQDEKHVEQDTEIHDLWVYIREWREKFGRLPKDEDELTACIDYVMKRQKPTIIIPKFRVGDKIRRKTPLPYDKDMQVARIECDYYLCNHLGKFSSETISFSEESNYELVEQKTITWSEEDEKMLYGLISIVEDWYNTMSEKEKEYYGDCGYINWLKSLKPNHWKPSEQNIKDLEWCADLVKDKMGVGFHRLQVFIDELKKL